MEETGKHDKHQNGIAAFYRLLLWLAVLFSLSETPFGRGEFLVDPDSRSAKLLRVLRSAPCHHQVTASDISAAATQLAGPGRFTPMAHAVEGAEPATAIPPTLVTLPGGDGKTRSSFAVAGLPQAMATGFSSRAPPSFA